MSRAPDEVRGARIACQTVLDWYRQPCLFAVADAQPDLQEILAGAYVEARAVLAEHDWSLQALVA